MNKLSSPIIQNRGARKATDIDFVLLLQMFVGNAIVWILPVPSDVYLALLALYAIRGPKQTIIAFSLMHLLVMGNKVLYPVGNLGLRWVVVMMGFVGVILHFFRTQNWRTFNISLPAILLIFLFILGPINVTVSFIPTISLLKIFIFSTGALTIVIAFQQTASLAKFWEKYFSTLFAFIILAGILILPLGMGFERNNSGYQGIFGHPQAFGPISAVIVAWFGGRWIYNKQGSFVDVLVILGGLAFTYMSQARTAVGALGLSFILGLLLYVFNGRIQAITTRLHPVIYLAIPILMVAYLTVGQTLAEPYIKEFIEKRTEDSSLAENFQESRGFLIDRSMQNFKEHPIFGIGMGVPSLEGLLEHTLETFMGIPISASVEKGFLPTAVLEELGILGSAISILILLGIVRPVVVRGTFPVLLVVLTCILVNIGEAIFFSLGGNGLFIWLMFGLGLIDYDKSV